ncbi:MULTISPECIES: RQC domain-containing protein [unclassified Bifidobacterium]|uniref:RQC domain-containing protein n=2 Tax=Bifidobacterium TaxID=1678 RepID=UPI001125DC6E|nr:MULTISPECIES: RQC domain-containing protein [unclassified Bifidobacterium]TPF78759.1 hypothetical protein BW09_01900 [Bifidobacterium sp. UTCIF-1]TPF80747.1 hypothetical protein BW08_03465 [Bifidobacterium sp. UTCIF-24]TPF82652.1 hypothetical protein BW12_04125 [Bifidobacterium sp. UTCIF-3]TPF84793.1 hypothetical protein BW07_03395 [Bifidobacterium sp. UTCIF-36]TPF90074.1 hypothetical protein BW10_03710 [Bifidobacterium sp. UTBIF-56]
MDANNMEETAEHVMNSDELTPLIAQYVVNVRERTGSYYGWRTISEALVGESPASVSNPLPDIDGYGFLAGLCTRDEVSNMIFELEAKDVVRVGKDTRIRPGANIRELLPDYRGWFPRPLRAAERYAESHGHGEDRKESGCAVSWSGLRAVPATDQEIDDMRTIIEFVNEEMRVIGHGYGKGNTIKALRGERRKDVVAAGLIDLDGYGSLKGCEYRYIRRLLQTLIEAKVLRYGKYSTIMPSKERDVAIVPDCLDWVVDEREFNQRMDERADAIARGGR